MSHPGSERVAPAARVRELDRVAIEERGIPSLVLMESAARSVADVVEEELQAGRAAEPVAIVCGMGNNGGDGLALARTLWNRGRRVQVVQVGASYARPDSLGADVRFQLGVLPGPVQDERVVVIDTLPGELDGVLEGAGLIVDAVFGTGLSRSVEGVQAAVLERIDQASAPCLGLDLPSGLDADDGSTLGPVPRCTRTVCLAVWKPGLLAGEGRRLAGKVSVAEIGLPRDLVEALPRLEDSH